MNYVRVRIDKRCEWGKVEGVRVVILDRAPWENARETGEKVALDMTRLLAPVTPSKVVLVGLNYREHVKESQSASAVPDEPVIFMKPSTAVIGPNDEIPCYSFLDRIDYEGELGAVIGRKLFRSGESNARDAIFGYTCLNDVTARHLQKKDVQWTRAKGFDGFCPIGPWIATGIDPLDLKIETHLNGELRQSGRSSEQVWNIFELVRFISGVMTLLPGDVVSTGTPRGVGPLKAGDVVRITVQEIGALENRVKQA